MNESIESKVATVVHMGKAISFFIMSFYYENTDSYIGFHGEISSTNEAQHSAIHHKFSSATLRTRNTFCEYFNNVGCVARLEEYFPAQKIILRSNAN